MHDSDFFPRVGKDASSRFWSAYERLAKLLCAFIHVTHFSPLFPSRKTSRSHITRHTHEIQMSLYTFTSKFPKSRVVPSRVEGHTRLATGFNSHIMWDQWRSMHWIPWTHLRQTTCQLHFSIPCPAYITNMYRRRSDAHIDTLRHISSRPSNAQVFYFHFVSPHDLFSLSIIVHLLSGSLYVPHRLHILI